MFVITQSGRYRSCDVLFTLEVKGKSELRKIYQPYHKTILNYRDVENTGLLGRGGARSNDNLRSENLGGHYNFLKIWGRSMYPPAPPSI